MKPIEAAYSCSAWTCDCRESCREESPDYTPFSVRIEKYLLDIGISQADIDAFRELMLTEPYPSLQPAE